jgi:beta-xylosidase
MIHNPILRGFCPDPSMIRVGDDVYIATSTFEWWPGVNFGIRVILSTGTIAKSP